MTKTPWLASGNGVSTDSALLAALHLGDEFNHDRVLSCLGSGTIGFAV